MIDQIGNGIQSVVDAVWLNPEWIVPYTSVFGLNALLPLYEILLAFVVLGGLIWLMKWATPKIAIIATTTAKECFYQPLFYLLAFGGIFLLIVFRYLPYNTLGEDIKLMKDSSLELIKVLAILLGVWSAGLSISEEIESNTFLTLLSKPLSRVQFILGKFIGVLIPVAVLFIILGGFLMYLVPGMLNESAVKPEPNELVLIMTQEMTQLLPALLLIFFEAVVLTAIAVAISTRLPMLANMVLCGTIYILGHFAPILVESGKDQFEVVQFAGQFLAVILPNLEIFNVEAKLMSGNPDEAMVPLLYLLGATVYTVLYTTVVMLFAFILFEGRDLA